MLSKPGKLTSEEFETVKAHPLIGKKILDPIGLPDDIIQAVLLHHKRYDLKGYPTGEYVSQLPLYARIIGVADAFDAMVSSRSYRQPVTIKEAIEELKRCSKKQFCPDIVKAMEELYIYNLEYLEKNSNI